MMRQRRLAAVESEALHHESERAEANPPPIARGRPCTGLRRRGHHPPQSLSIPTLARPAAVQRGAARGRTNGMTFAAAGGAGSAVPARDLCNMSARKG